MSGTAPSAPTADDLATPAHFRWNAAIFVAECALFFLAGSFISTTTVLPALIARLSGSEMVVGVSSGLFSGACVLPQIFAAGLAASSERKKPLVLRAGWVRALAVVAVVSIGLLGTAHPMTNLAIVLGGMTLFFVADGFVGVPWFDLFAKCVPVRRRGRLIGTAQIAGNLGGIGVGLVVRSALSEEGRWGFPGNYALLFALAAVLFVLATLLLSLIREPASHLESDKLPRPREILRQIPAFLAADRPFRILVAVNLALGFVGVASAFYVLHATHKIGLGGEATGLFVSAQVIGGLAAGLLMSVVQDRYGPRMHIRIATLSAGLPAILALCADQLASPLGPGVLYLYLGAFFFLGIYGGSQGWPFYNWILEYAGPTQRPLYIGMLNTCGALVILAPTLGGWVVDAISYRAVFGLSLLFALGTLMLSRALPSPRRNPVTQP